MIFRLTLALFISLIVISCSKDKKIVYQQSEKVDPFAIYKEGLEAFEINDFFYASKKFSEAELNFENVDLAAKSAIMSSFSLYGINFYTEALENLERYLKKYPADKNVVYAHYLIAIVHYEQISDERKDLKPLLYAKDSFNLGIEKFPLTDFAIDSKYKLGLINDLLAAKEMYIARHYIKKEKFKMIYRILFLLM